MAAGSLRLREFAAAVVFRIGEYYTTDAAAYLEAAGAR